MTDIADITKQIAQRLHTVKKGVLMKYNVKFEWLYIVLITLILTAIFFFVQDADVRTQIISAFIGMLTLVGGYLFGKSAPDK